MLVTDLALSPSPDSYTVAVDDEAIVLDEATGTLHLLNHTAALVWACLDGVSPLGEICEDLSEALGVPLPQVVSEVDTLAHQLLADGLATAPGFHRPLVERPIGPGCDCCGDDLDPRLLLEPPNP